MRRIRVEGRLILDHGDGTAVQFDQTYVVVSYGGVAVVESVTAAVQLLLLEASRHEKLLSDIQQAARAFGEHLAGVADGLFQLARSGNVEAFLEGYTHLPPSVKERLDTALGDDLLHELHRVLLLTT